MKIKFDFDYELPLNKTMEIRSMIIVVMVIFHENTKYYPQVFWDACLHWLWIIKKCYLNNGFKFQTYVCNRCHDLLKIFMNLSNASISKAKSADYRCIITGFSSEAMKLLQKKWFDWKKWNIIRKINIKSNIETINLLRILIYGKF